MRVLVCGGRDFGDLPLSNGPHGGCDKKHPQYTEKFAQYWFVRGILEKFVAEHSLLYVQDDNWLPSDIHIISGEARGVDSIATDFAMVNWCGYSGYPVTPEEWETLGKKAGVLRNQRMLDDGKPDVVIAFPGGRGTADMISRAKKAGVKVIEVTYP